jgi:hypothetical protein
MAVLTVTFNVHDWEKMDDSTYRNRTTRLCKSKVTFSLYEQYKLELRDFIRIQSGVLLIKSYLNHAE